MASMTVSGSLRAGGGTADLTPAVGAPLGGYGNRTGSSTGVLDPLLARAAVFDDGTTRAGIVVCDLLGVHRRIVEEARRHAAEQAGVDHLIVAATHTHAGPMAAVTPGDDQDWATSAATAIGAAVARAADELEAVTLKATTVEVDGIGHNRRDHAGPHEARLQVLTAERSDGTTAVTLLHHACHATVLESDNLQFSADFPGAACRSVEAAVGGTAVYVQGACGDINPVWMSHEHREAERVGSIVGLAGARAVQELKPVGAGQWVINLSYSEELAVEPRPGTVVAGGAIRGASRLVDLERRVMPTEAEIDEAVATLGAVTGDADARRRARAEINRLEMERVYGRFAPAEPGKTHKAEVQVLRIGPDLAFVTLPGEFFVETGWELARRAHIPHLIVAGYANHYLGYVPVASEFDRHGYEVGCARFTPPAAEQFVDAALALLADVG